MLRLTRASTLLAAVLLAAHPASTAAQWPQLCVSGPTYSAWNETRCPSTATCCPNSFSMSGHGCCPFEKAVCCSNYGQCCPAGTTCVSQSGSTYDEVFACVSPTAANVTSLSTCKPGPALPFSVTKKNVLIIGDSVSIGYTPYVAAALADVALVQHAPWDLDDGGAEETAYGLQCLDSFLASPSGMPIVPDVIYFNFGLHDGPMNNATIPGQNANTTLYAVQLTQIAVTLQAWTRARGAKLISGLTSPMMCNASGDGCVVNLNNQAAAIMGALGIPTLNLHDAVVAKCGPVPQASCFGEKGGFCPHSIPAGYEWLAQSTVAPAIRALL